eukprot:4842916-Amphidinium_carterae.2
MDNFRGREVHKDSNNGHGARGGAVGWLGSHWRTIWAEGALRDTRCESRGPNTWRAWAFHFT